MGFRSRVGATPEPLFVVASVAYQSVYIIITPELHVIIHYHYTRLTTKITESASGEPSDIGQVPLAIGLFSFMRGLKQNCAKRVKVKEVSGA